MLTLYYQPWRSEGARLRLALAASTCPWQAQALPWAAAEIFFELGVAEYPAILQTETNIYTDSLEILQNFSNICPESKLASVSLEDWQGLSAWSSTTAWLLARLTAPVALASTALQEENAWTSYKNAVAQHFGQSLEALANDRYSAYAHFARDSKLKALSQHLEKNSFYNGHCSLADCWLTADLFPLQFLDGIGLPISLRYYWQRVMHFCGCDLSSDWLIS